MLRVLASHTPDALGVITEDEVVGFLDSSFAAHQARDGGDHQWSLDSLRAGFGAQMVQRAKRAMAATMWISNLPIERIELNLTQHLRQRGGVAGTVRAVADRSSPLT